MSQHLGSRVTAGAKFFYRGDEKFWVRGATYGTFAPREGGDYPAPERVAQDFALMREAGINTVRVYTAPPRYLLDEAERHGLSVIVGLAWMQHVCFLDDAKLQGEIRAGVRAGVRACAGHPAVLAFAVGNEIPAQIVRWHGRRKVERFLKTLCDDVKREAPGALVTYVNYPPTDYLDLPFLDFICFNVFLHEPADFRAYLAKLQNIAGQRPLVLSEVGLDSLRAGPEAQARFLDWQLREAFAGGAAGICVFAWTDDWYRGGHQIEDWAFGLVDAGRAPKPAFSAVRERFARLPFAPFDAEAQRKWPKVSVVICAYNAAATLEDNLDSLLGLRYPNYEVIVVNDGSRDATPEIAARYPFRLISVPNGGLSAARNLGLRAATGEIVAYTDADTRVDPDWLAYLVQPFLATDAVGVGGPNVVPPDDDWVAQCVARSPGGPTHVLLDDTTAEHIPGCNMAFRKWALDEIGGFDATYTKAGDDVDVCWRLQERGWHLAFSPAALVWHHHRNSVDAYWRQQVGYGEGESFLEQRHQEKFNERGQTRWQGRIYSPLPAYRSLFKSVIYHGRWGSSAFPSIYQGGVNGWHCLPQMVEWQALSVFCLLASPLLPALLLPVALLGFGATVWRCVAHALATPKNLTSQISNLKFYGLSAWLHSVQPWARLRGRVKGYRGPSHRTEWAKQLLESAPWLTPRETLGLLFRGWELTFWDVHYTSLEGLLGGLKAAFEATLSPTRCDDGWQQEYDLQARAGHACSLKVKLTAEDHGGTKRLFRAHLALDRRWRLLAAPLAAAGAVGYGLGLGWGLVVLAAAGGWVLGEVSRRGGQARAVAEMVATEMKLFVISPEVPAEAEESEPAFGD